MPSETLASSPRRSPPPATSTTSRPFAPPPLPPLAPVTQQPGANNSIPPSPAFSPITPRAVPVLPAISIPPQAPPPPPPQNGAHTPAMPPAHTSAQPADAQQQQQLHSPPPQQQPQQPPSAIAPTTFIPPPPSQPFSSEDSTDAIALRAAISSLQIQKKKAQDDIRTLEKVRKQALDDPERFKSELAAGNVQEKKMTAGDIRAILDAASDDEDDSEEDERMTNSDEHFTRIPGPQNIVRMPHINWDKYHVVGEPLDRLHEQQRKWPGNMPTGGREFAVAAPYSPWLDTLEDGGGKDSVGGSLSGASGNGTVSEHPMETRRGGVRK